MAYRPERGWGFAHRHPAQVNDPPSAAAEVEALRRRVTELESKIGTEAVNGTTPDPDLRFICCVVFKLFRIPVNQWSLATAALGGIIGVALLLLIMNYNHPFTKNARIYFSVTPVLPGVRGRVVDVPAQANAPLKEGDVLFRIDPKPYEYVVQQKKAALAEAEQM